MRRCTFTNCAVFDIFSNGQMAGRPIKNVLIESCILDATRRAACRSTVNLKGGAEGWTFRGNSILARRHAPQRRGCGPGFRFEKNAIQNATFGWIGPQCGRNVMAAPAPGQQQANPVGSSPPPLAPCDLNACYRNDLRVLPGSPAGLAGAGVPA